MELERWFTFCPQFDRIRSFSSLFFTHTYGGSICVCSNYWIKNYGEHCLFTDAFFKVFIHSLSLMPLQLKSIPGVFKSHNRPICHLPALALMLSLTQLPYHLIVE